MDVSFTVNGTYRAIGVEPRRTLADVLRDDLGLTGTHLGCEHGACGACTVLVDGRPVRACLLLAVQCEGAEVLTIEGLAGTGELHPVQRAFVDNFGLQCGFCTPGFVMLLVGALEAGSDLDDDALIEVLSSNLCRCTGYKPIIDAARQARSAMSAE